MSKELLRLRPQAQQQYADYFEGQVHYNLYGAPSLRKSDYYLAGYFQARARFRFQLGLGLLLVGLVIGAVVLAANWWAG